MFTEKVGRWHTGVSPLPTAKLIQNCLRLAPNTHTCWMLDFGANQMQVHHRGPNRRIRQLHQATLHRCGYIVFPEFHKTRQHACCTPHVAAVTQLQYHFYYGLWPGAMQCGAVLDDLLMEILGASYPAEP